jgi:hypothetical protein
MKVSEAMLVKKLLLTSKPVCNRRKLCESESPSEVVVSESISEPVTSKS